MTCLGTVISHRQRDASYAFGQDDCIVAHNGTAVSADDVVTFGSIVLFLIAQRRISFCSTLSRRWEGKSLCTYVHIYRSPGSPAFKLLTKYLPAPLKIEGKSVIPTPWYVGTQGDMTIGVIIFSSSAENRLKDITRGWRIFHVSLKMGPVIQSHLSLLRWTSISIPLEL